jgi:uncharacterized protein YrrD
MQCSINSLIGYTMEATDGELGKVVDFYFDDQTWTIRYLILESGNWLTGRKLLISPEALVKTSWKSGTFPVNLTKEQIRNSPDIDTEKPVSRQQEIELYGHYPWQSYWGSGFYPGGVWGITDSPEEMNNKILEGDYSGIGSDADLHAADDPHLRSMKQVTGYHIDATDGEIGHVKDFIVDDQTWQLESLVVDTHNWFGGKKVLVAVTHIRKLEWSDSKVFVDTTVDSIKNSTAIDESEFVHPESSVYGSHTIHLK